MALHEDRVVVEEKELHEKTAKLGAFLLTPVFGSLDREDQLLLKEQHKRMNAYADVLRRRIARFG